MLSDRWQLLRVLLQKMELRYGLLYVGATVSALLDLLGVGLVFPLLTRVVSGGGGMSALPRGLQHVLDIVPVERLTLGGAVALLLAVFMAKNAVKFWVLYSNSRIVTEMRRDWMNRLFAIYLNAGFLYFVQTRHGQLLYNLTDLTYRSMYGLRQLVGMWLHGITGLLAAALLFVISPLVTVLSLGAALAVWLVTYRSVTPRVARLGRQVLARHRDASNIASEALRGIREVKIYSLEKGLYTRYRQAHNEAARRATLVHLFENIPGAVPEVLLVSTLGAALLILDRREVDLTVLIPLLATYAYAYLRVLLAGAVLVRSAVAFISEWPFIAHLSQEVQQQEYPEVPDGRQTPLAAHATLELLGVTYQYPQDTHPALVDLTATFEHGYLYLVTGDSGTGKSTLVALLTRLLDPVRGEIRYGNASIAQFSLRAWRKRIGYVGQEPFLFHGTVRENIAVRAAQEFSEGEVHTAARLADAHEFILKLPQGYDTVLGEHGTRLSAGQRQRIALARALFARPDVLLLDEAVSAVDEHAEQRILQNLTAVKAGAIVILITHRLGAARFADHLLTLQDGRLIETSDARPPSSLVQVAQAV